MAPCRKRGKEGLMEGRSRELHMCPKRMVTAGKKLGRPASLRE